MGLIIDSNDKSRLVTDEYSRNITKLNAIKSRVLKLEIVRYKLVNRPSIRLKS
jgi:hypothetical protein